MQGRSSSDCFWHPMFHLKREWFCGVFSKRVDQLVWVEVGLAVKLFGCFVKKVSYQRQTCVESGNCLIAFTDTVFKAWFKVKLLVQVDAQIPNRFFSLESVSIKCWRIAWHPTFLRNGENNDPCGTSARISEMLKFHPDNRQMLCGREGKIKQFLRDRPGIFKRIAYVWFDLILSSCSCSTSFSMITMQLL